MNILLTGGAGFIGSVTAQMALRDGHHVVIYDNLCSGHRAAVSKEAIFIEGDISNRSRLEDTLRSHKIDAVMHFGASSLVAESMKNPSKYFSNNIGGGVSLLDAIIEVGIPKIIFSSTAAVYGNPEIIPILESNTTLPANPYGESKLAFEKILKWYSLAHGLSYVILRYFNAAGASDLYGEDHNPETHLIPLVLKTAMEQREKIIVNGTDYKTRDGSCIRDYIHVEDLAKAHLRALVSENSKNQVFNLGNGEGYSVLEIIEASKRITGKKITVEFGPRREGDPPVLVASSKKIKSDLGWNPEYTSIESIIESAYRWFLKNPNGYSK